MKNILLEIIYSDERYRALYNTSPHFKAAIDALGINKDDRSIIEVVAALSEGILEIKELLVKRVLSEHPAVLAKETD